MAKIKILLFIGNTMVGDINKYAQNRHLSETLKSEQTSAVSDSFTFSISWRKFSDFIGKQFSDSPETFLRVGKARIVVLREGDTGYYVRFAGWLAARPARSGPGSAQILSLTFYEWFTRLSGDLVCDPTDKKSPVRQFTNRPGQLYAQDLISEMMARSAAAGDPLNWSFGSLETLPNKTATYKDFQTVAKALCDAMNNTTGTGKFDVVFRTDILDYSHQIIDVTSFRGIEKNIVIKYPGDGVYSLWSSTYEVDETNEYASDLLVAGNGQVGDPSAGEDTANLGTASDSDFASEYCYWRAYESQSSIESQEAVDAYATKLLSQRAFSLQTPQIQLVGRPIEWGNAGNEDNGLAIGDIFMFKENVSDGVDNSGRMRIIGMETDWDNNGVETVEPALLRMPLS